MRSPMPEPASDLFGFAAALTERERAAPFEAWWLLVPASRRVAKVHARRAFMTACTKIEYSALMLATKRWADSVAGTDAMFIPHPATWLNGERWLDAEPAVKPDTKPALVGHQIARYTPPPSRHGPVDERTRAAIQAVIERAAERKAMEEAARPRPTPRYVKEAPDAVLRAIDEERKTA